MSDRFDALAVRESNGKSYFTKIGVAFKSRTGNGYSLLLDAIPAPTDGQFKILLMEPKPRDANRQFSGGGTSGRESVGDYDGEPAPF